LADIVLIYGKENKETAKHLVSHLEERWSIWWDEHIKVRFAEEIQEEIHSARCAVVLWSQESREKDTVRDDAQLAKDHDVPIVGVSLDGSKPAYGFGGYLSSPLWDWNSKSDHPDFEKLFARLKRLLPAPQAPKQRSAIANGRVPLPQIFLSVSSFETQLVPDQAVKALRIAGVPAILVSAWDLVELQKPDPLERDPTALIEELRRYREAGGFILLDSGNYESSRLSMHDWEPSDLEQALGLGLHVSYSPSVGQDLA
jgi:hypothetical protein